MIYYTCRIWTIRYNLPSIADSVDGFQCISQNNSELSTLWVVVIVQFNLWFDKQGMQRLGSSQKKSLPLLRITLIFLLSAFCSCYSFCFSLWLPKSNWDLILWFSTSPVYEFAFMISCILHLLQALCVNIISQTLTCGRLV